MPHVDAVTALGRLGGVASPAAVRTLSTRRRLRTAMAKGLVVRLPGRDLVAVATIDADRSAAARLGGVLSHTSAALALGWAVADVPEVPYVTVPHHIQHDAEPADAELLVRRLPSPDVAGWHTTPVRTVLDCARDLAFPEALAVADSALRSGAISHAEIVAAASRVRGPHAEQVRRVTAYADGRAQNAFESELRGLCITAGLDVIVQWEVRAQGLVLHPDMADPVRGIAVEADSWEHHAEKRKDWVDDVVRYNALTSTGWRVVRFTWEQVRFNKRYVVSVLTALMADRATT